MNDVIIEKRIEISQKMIGLFLDPAFHDRFIANAEANSDGMIAIIPAHAEEDASLSLKRMGMNNESSRFLLVSNVNGELLYNEFQIVAGVADAGLENISLDNMTTEEWLRMVSSGQQDVSYMFSSEKVETMVLQIFS